MARGKPSASGGSVARTTRSAASKNAQPARSPSPVPAKVASGRKRGRRGGAAPEKADGGEHVDEQAEREAAKPGDRITRAQTSHDIVEPPQEEHLSGDEDEGPGSPPAGSLPMVKPEPAYYQGALGAKRVKREHFVKCEPGPVGETGMEAGTEEGTEEGDDPMTDAKFEVHTKPPYDEKQEERQPACQLGVVVPPPPTSTLGPAAAPGPAALADLETDNTLTEVATTVAAAVAAATATAATTTTTAATVPKPAAAARKGRRPQKQQAAAATAAAAHSVSVVGTQALAAGEATPAVGAVVVSAVPPPASVVAVASGSAAGTVATTGRVLRMRHSARNAGVVRLTTSPPAHAAAVAAGVTVAAAPVAGVAEAASDGTNGSLRSLAQEAINLRPTAGKLTAKQSKVCADFADAAYVKARKANVVARAALEKAKSSSGKPAPAAPAAAEGAVARDLREAMTKAFAYSCAPSPGQGKRLLQRQGIGALGAAGAVTAGAMQQQLLQVVDATAAMQAVHAAVQAGAAAAASAAVGQAACLQPTLPGVLQLLGAPPMYEPLRPGYGAGAGGFMQQAPAGGCPYTAAAATAAAAAAAGQLATGVQGMSLAAAGGSQQMQQAIQQMQAASLFQAQQLQQAQCMWMQPADAPATAPLVGAGVASAVGALVPPPHWGNQLASVPSQHHLQQQQEHQQYYHHQYHQQHHHLLPAACAAASAAAGPCWSSCPPLAPPSFPTPYPPLAGASSGAGSSMQYVQQPQPQQQLQQSHRQQHMLEAPAPLAYQLPPPQHQHQLPAPPYYSAGALAALSVPAPATGAAPLADAAPLANAAVPAPCWEPGTSTQAAALLAAAGGAKADDLIEDIGGIRNAAEMEHPFQVPPWSGGAYGGAAGGLAAAADLVTAASADAAGAAGIVAGGGGHAQTLSAAPRSPSPSYAYHVFRQDLDCGGDAEAVDDLEDDLRNLMASDSPPLPLDLEDLTWLPQPPLPLSQQHQQHEVQHLQHSQHPPPLHQALALAPPAAGVASQE